MNRFRRRLAGAWSLCLLATMAGAATPARAATPGEVLRDCPDCPAMVVLPAGRYTMGAAADQRFTADQMDTEPARGRSYLIIKSSPATPAHRVSIRKAFAIGARETSYAEFAAFVKASGYESSSRNCVLVDIGAQDNSSNQYTNVSSQVVPSRGWQTPPVWPKGATLPVTCVGWGDAQAYADWLSKKTGQRYRLPSEAEWEYAARAGTATHWYWGDDAAQACQYANLSDLAFMRQRLRTGPSPAAVPGGPNAHVPCDDGQPWNAPIGAYKPNAFGLYDMIGNVSEMTADCWHADYGGAPADGSAWTRDGDCRFRVLRGDNGMLDLQWSHAAYRNGVPEGEYRATNGGFRLVREL